jgi:branched-chain amino acid transport system substrate-binding protein
MGKVMHQFRLVALTLALLGGLSPAALAQTPGVTANEIRIGTFGPITGANFVFGKLPMNGLEVVFSKINEAGGIEGRKLTLVRQDDQCDPANAIAAVRKLIHTEQVFAIVGGSCSNGVIAAKPDIVESGIPFVNFAAASNLISAPKVSNIFTTMLTSNLESKLQARYLAEQSKKRVAIISQRDAWGRDRYDSFLQELNKHGLEKIADEELSMEANDSTAQVLRIQSAKPDAVVMLSYPKPAAIFLRDAARLGFKTTFIGTSVIPDPVAFFEQVGVPGATDNFLAISPSRYVFDAPETEAWRKRLSAAFPNERNHGYNLYGIVAGETVAAALKNAGKDLTREGFIKALEGLKGLDVELAPGKLDCTDHQCLKAASWIRRSPSGQAEIVSRTSLE